MYFANLLKRPFYHACIHHTYIYGQAHNMDIIQVLIDTLYFYWSFFLSTFRMLLEWFETTSSNIPNITDLYPFHITSCSFRIILQYTPKKGNAHGCTWTDLPSQKHP